MTLWNTWNPIIVYRLLVLNMRTSNNIAQSAEAVEYNDCTSAEG